MNIALRQVLLVIAAVSLAIAATVAPGSSASSDRVPPSPTDAYVALDPVRLLDTRSTAPVGSDDDDGDSVRVAVAGRAGVPTTDIAAVALNITVVDAAAAGYATVYDCGQRPPASNLNFGVGDTIANLALSGVSDNGAVCVFVRGRGDLLVDVLGYFPTTAGYSSIEPARLVDTRTGPALAGGETLTVKVTTHRDIPADAAAVKLTLTAVEARADGFATVYPCGDRPHASNLNFTAGQTIANAAVTALSPSGEICIFSDATIDVLVDVVGYLDATASLQPAAPRRIVDTRDTGLRLGTPDGDGDPLEITVSDVGRDGRARLGAVAMNLTVVDALDAGHLTVYPCGVRPEASNLNFAVGQTIANAVIAAVSESGTVCVHARGRVHLMVDSTSTVQDPRPSTTTTPTTPSTTTTTTTSPQPTTTSTTTSTSPPPTTTSTTTSTMPDPDDAELEPFVMNITVDTDDTEMQLPLRGAVDVEIDWGFDTSTRLRTEDPGCPSTVQDDNLNDNVYCLYPTAGDYTITISAGTGTGPHLERFGDGTSEYLGANLITSVDSFGELGLVSLHGAFFKATQLTTLPTTLPDSITDLRRVLRQTTIFNQNLNGWDVSGIADLSHVFDNAQGFNNGCAATTPDCPLTWDTSSATTTAHMFEGALIFDQPLPNFDTSSVTTMSSMFSNARAFNQDIGDWDTGQVTTMSSMFLNAQAFNQDIGDWETGQVTTMFKMFEKAGEFNQDIGPWDTSRVTDMENMFTEATKFNGDISSWDTGQVTNMKQMFKQARAFNADISEWKTGRVTNMNEMFENARAFNADISVWNTGQVTDMTRMFDNTDAFNRNLSGWCVSRIAAAPANFAPSRVTRPVWGTCPQPLEVTAARQHTCVLFRDGRIKCWGSSLEHQLGLGESTDRGRSPGQMGDALPFVDVDTNVQSMSDGRAVHNCIIDDLGRVKCWGRNGFGELGIGDTTNRGNNSSDMGANLHPVNLGSGRTAKQIAVGEHHSCAILDNDELKCWGWNEFGQLGLEDSRDRTGSDTPDGLPPVDLGPGRHAVEISLGDLHTCAILDDGSLKCWGRNNQGQLGLGDTDNRGSGTGQMGGALLPVNLGTGRTATAVTAGREHTCAILDDDTVKCWGNNNSGRLGLGDTTHRGGNPATVPASIPAVNLGSDRTAIAISAGQEHTCVILDDDTVKCWGANGSSGALGLGDTNNRGSGTGQMGDNLPAVDLGTGRTAVAISAGGDHACAILDNDTVKCWGSNGAGRLGLGDTTNRGRAPDQMGDDLPAVRLVGPSS